MLSHLIPWPSDPPCVSYSTVNLSQQENEDSDRRMNSKYAPDCWEQKDDLDQESGPSKPDHEVDPSKPPCIWQLYPDEPEKRSDAVWK